MLLACSLWSPWPKLFTSDNGLPGDEMELRGLLEFTVGRVEKDELTINSSEAEHPGSVSSTRETRQKTDS